MFQVKICGVTNGDDAQAIAEAGADAIGINFYERSSRFVDEDQARAILQAVPDRVMKVGVFVNATVKQVCRIYDSLQLDLIQLHGDEPPPYLGLLRGRPVMRAFRCGQFGFDQVTDYLTKCRDLRCMPRLVLVDGYYPGQYGGTGTVADWTAIASSRPQLKNTPVVLAGGLKPDNVARAIATVRPSAVDTATGVEVRAGQKDIVLVRSFVSAARIAFEQFHADAESLSGEGES